MPIREESWLDSSQSEPQIVHQHVNVFLAPINNTVIMIMRLFWQPSKTSETVWGHICVFFPSKSGEEVIESSTSLCSATISSSFFLSSPSFCLSAKDIISDCCWWLRSSWWRQKGQFFELSCISASQSSLSSKTLSLRRPICKESCPNPLLELK